MKVGNLLEHVILDATADGLALHGASGLLPLDAGGPLHPGGLDGSAGDGGLGGSFAGSGGLGELSTAAVAQLKGALNSRQIKIGSIY